MDHIQYAYSQSFAQKGVCLIYIRAAFYKYSKERSIWFLGILKERQGYFTTYITRVRDAKKINIIQLMRGVKPPSV